MNRAIPEGAAPGTALAGTALADALILGRLGEGGRSTVYHARWKGRDAALKLYKPAAVERHARKHPQPLAEFEHSRNSSFYGVPGLSLYVAEPLGFVVEEAVQAFMQEKLDGELYYFYYRARAGKVTPALFEQVERMVALYHRAGLYDVDLHAMNVMVVNGPDGQPIPKLFDFNLIPFHVRAPNKLVGLLLKLGLLGLEWRDLRMLRDFHNFARVETKLLKYYR